MTQEKKPWPKKKKKELICLASSALMSLQLSSLLGIIKLATGDGGQTAAE